MQQLIFYSRTNLKFLSQNLNCKVAVQVVWSQLLNLLRYPSNFTDKKATEIKNCLHYIKNLVELCTEKSSIHPQINFLCYVKERKNFKWNLKKYHLIRDYSRKKKSEGAPLFRDNFYSTFSLNWLSRVEYLNNLLLEKAMQTSFDHYSSTCGG